MHKNRRRRNEIIVRTLTYVVMTVAVISLALLCLFIVLGYSINQKTGQAQQGGLIQFRSFPDNADISVDGQKQNFTTPGKTTSDATPHTVNMTKKDYRSWNKNFTLGRGELLWLNARLVPNSVTTNEVEQFESLSQTMASPDKKWIAVLEKANEPLLKIIDIRDETKPKSLSLKIPLADLKPLTPTDSFTIGEWDFGSRYLLVKHVSGATTEWLRVDRTNEANATNVTNRFKLDFSTIHFVGGSGENFYGVSGGELRHVSFGQTTLPSPIAQNVSEFSLYGDNKMALVTQKNNQQIVSVYREGDKAPTLVETVAQTAPAVHVALTRFFGDDYVAVSHSGETKLIKQPFDAKPTVVTKMKTISEAQWLYFSPNGQFLIAQNGALVATYNLERDQTTRFTAPGDGPYTRADHLRWLDDFHFWNDQNGTLRSFEFDGSNAEIINNVTPGQDITLSDNGKRLFSIGTNTTTKTPVLQSSVMVVE